MTKISEFPLLGATPPGAYIPVVDPTETDPANQNKRMELAVLLAPNTSNFTSYAEDALNSPGDFVEFENDIWKYVGVTPTTGQSPAESPELWQLTDSGALAHAQNTDTHTNSGSFEIGKTAGAFDQPTGSNVLILAGPHGESKGAIRYFWEMDGLEKVFRIQKTVDYTGTGADVWLEWADNANNLPYSPADAAFFGAASLLVNAALDALAAKKLNIQAATGTGTTISFTTDRTYNTLSTPGTGNITFDLTGAKNCATAIVMHSSGVEPTVGGKVIGDNSGTAKRQTGARNYVLSGTNIFTFIYLEGPPPIVVFYVSQI